MRAVVLRAGALEVSEIPEPQPGPGQLLVAPISTGICGSDLSAREHTDDFLAGHEVAGARHSLFDPTRDLVLGHEFTSEVIEVGRDVTEYAVGDRLVTLPFAIDDAGAPHTVGYSNAFPGGLAERVVVQAVGHLKIPAGVSASLAAITEPMATGVNGVRRSRIQPPTGALVTGCGPVGLGAIVELVSRGVHPVVASDPSPVRRHAADRLGADAVVDPGTVDPVATWAELAGAGEQLFVFEASGKPGILDTLIASAPMHTRIYAVGTVMTADTFRPLISMLKNIAVEYVTGPAREETSYGALAAMFDHLCSGRVDTDSIVTGYAGYDAVAEVFDLLRPRDPHAIEHVKVLIRPDLAGAQILAPAHIP